MAVCLCLSVVFRIVSWYVCGGSSQGVITPFACGESFLLSRVYFALCHYSLKLNGLSNLPKTFSGSPKYNP